VGLALFVIACLVMVAGLLIIGKGSFTPLPSYRGEKPEPRSIRGVGTLVLLVGLVILGLDSFTVVGSKDVAVQTSFGKPVGTLDNGFHLVRPWSSTESFSASRQALKLSGGGDDNGDPIVVRLANGTTAKVEVSAEWRLNDKADITQLYLDYKTFDKITENVIRRRLSAVLNRVFEKYDPLASISGKGETLPLALLEGQARDQLQAEVPQEIIIESLYVPKIEFDAGVQSQINQFINAVNETKIAKQQLETATARKAANAELGSGKLSAEILYQNCLDLVERLTKDGKTLPPAFTCGVPPGTVISVK
jgi:regulator of protease activity HflC (stomatin/prohibitin superfamily)